MIRIADLHTHSAASDGQYSPTELVELAKKKGIDVLALTDHDNIDGVDEAIAAGERLGVRVLRGVELSAEDHLNLHILGYCFDSSVSQAFFDSLKERRDARKYRIAGYLRGKGLDIDLPAVEKHAQGGVIGRPHFAEWMTERGMVSSMKEAFDRYLDTPEFHRIDPDRPSAETCVRTLKKAGGFVSLAHPYQIVLNGETLEDLIERLAGYGLDAIECYYTKHTPEMEAEYLRLAEKYRLHVTGGSDFHGEKRKPDYPMKGIELELNWLIGQQI